MDIELRIFVEWSYNKKRKKSKISDDDLRSVAAELIEEIKNGSTKAALGGGIFKKRLGDEDSARTIVAYHHGDKLYFIDGWEKKEIPKNKREIDDSDLKVFRQISKAAKAYTAEQVEKLEKNRIYVELPSINQESENED